MKSGLDYFLIVRLISLLSLLSTTVSAQEVSKTQTRSDKDRDRDEYQTNKTLSKQDLEAFSTVSLGLPVCDTIQELNIDFEKFLLKENRYQYVGAKDTLNYIYCHAVLTDHTELMANVLAKLAAYTINHENDDKVFERFVSLLNASIELSEKHNYIIPLANAYELYCSNFTSNKLFGLATLYADKFIETAYDSDDSVLIAEGHMHLGRMLRDQGDFAKSDSVLRISLQYLTKSGSSKTVGAWTYLHLASLKRLEGKFEESVEYGKKGIAVTQANPYAKDFQIAFLALEIIQSNIELGNFENDEWLNKLNINNPSKWIKGQYNYILGVINQKKDREEEAEKHYLEAIRASYIAGSYQSVFAISRRLFPLMSKKDLNPHALEVYQILQDATNKVIQQNGSNNLLRSAFFKLESEKDRRSLLQQQLENSQRVILFSISLILLFLVLIGLIYRQNKKAQMLNLNIKRLNIDLVEQNEKLEESQSQLQAANEKLTLILDQKDKVNQRLQKFASVLAHDFKEPIRTIVSFGKLLSRSILPKINESETEFFNFVIEGTGRLNRMVDRLYQYSENTLALTKTFQAIDLDNTLEDVRKDLQLQIEEKKGQLQINAFSHQIIGDKVLIYQLFQNLISNALKYSKEDEPSIISISNRLEHNYFIVSIADNGIGIKETPSLDIFALFSRTAQVSEKEGHGLGLATCKEIVEIHGGKIDYTSEVGVGTTFHIWFRDFQPKSV